MEGYTIGWDEGSLASSESCARLEHPGRTATVEHPNDAAVRVLLSQMGGRVNHKEGDNRQRKRPEEILIFRASGDLPPSARRYQIFDSTLPCPFTRMSTTARSK
jgi:hypothetical protein